MLKIIRTYFQINQFAVKLLTFILFLSFIQKTSASGVEGARLDLVQLGISSTLCTRIMFRSSQQYKQTLFVVPRVEKGTGNRSERLYNIEDGEKKGTYNLSVHLFFPVDDESVRSFYASEASYDAKACDWSKVIDRLNLGVTDPVQKIQTISLMPLTSIQLSLPGFKNSAVIGSLQGVDVLDYAGKSLTAQFVISEYERTVFEKAIVSSEGIASLVKFTFNASRRNGKVSVTIDTSTIIEQLKADFAAANPLKLISSNIEASLKRAFSKNAIHILTEQGTGAGAKDFQDVSQKVIDKVLAELKIEMASISEQTPEPENKPKDESSAKLFKLDAVIKSVQTATKTDFSYESIAAAENATATGELKLLTDKLNELNVKSIKIGAGEQDPSTGYKINKGEAIRITPASWSRDVVEYKSYIDYLTLEDIHRLNLSGTFPDILNPNIKIEDVTINGQTLAIGRWSSSNDRSMFQKVAPTYRWARESVIARKYQSSSGRLDYSLPAILDKLKASANTPEQELSLIKVGFKDLRIGLSFSELGDSRIFLFEDIFDENPFWKADLINETGQIVLTAKQDLGSVRFREKMNQKADPDREILADEELYRTPLALDKIGELKYTVLSSVPTVVHKEILKSDKIPLKSRKYFTFYVSKPKILSQKEIALDKLQD